MNRRNYIRTAGIGFAAVSFAPSEVMGRPGNRASIRLGGPLFDSYDEPGQWAELLRRSGYRAAYCPVKPSAEINLIKAYEEAATQHDIVIAEVGTWSNTISLIPGEAEAAVEKCILGLHLADQIGAMCCVNISGSKNETNWAGPHKDNLTPEVFDQVVETTRKIIDAVKPRRSYFALEAMPWSFPDSTETYLQLLKAVRRKHFGVHLDPVNMIRSPREYFNNGALIKEMFKQLGPHIRSCHAKDITLREDNYIPQMDELRPGLGNLDYTVFLRELAKLKEIPLMMEHLKSAEEYELAARYIRSVGKSIRLAF